MAPGLSDPRTDANTSDPRVGADPGDPRVDADLAEPVHESAPLARWIAERLCHVDPKTGESCAWYHGFRQYLRALGLAITPAHHADFLRDTIAALAGAGQRVRVLVSGAIDYSMFAHVLWACGECGVFAEVTVVDVCETPLFLNLWYAQRIGVPVTTVRSNILAYEPAGCFDFICTNAFFGQFSPEQRPHLMARWHSLLAPDGRVITVAPIRPGSGSGLVGFTPREARALRDAVHQSACDLVDPLDLDPDALAQLADAFTARMRVHPVRSLQEIEALFEHAGFALEHLSDSRITDACSTLTGPTVSRSAPYALVVACRESRYARLLA